MSVTTYDPLTASMQALLDRGEDVSLNDYTNVAFGAPGADVLALVHRGLWVEKRRHLGDDPFARFTVYGPPQ